MLWGYSGLIITVLFVGELARGQEYVMFTQRQEGQVIRISSALSFEAALSLMSDQDSEIATSFRSELTSIISANREGFDAVYWECPPCSISTLASQKFEFILMPTNELTQPPVRLGEIAFIDKLVPTQGRTLAVEFANIARDSVLVSPLPEEGATTSNYSHLKAFLKSAPTEKIDAWWAATANAYSRTVRDAAGKKIWLSTHGGGVEFLHARIDARPKYYHYEGFKNA